MSKYNFNIYGLSGVGTVVDMQQSDNPSNRIQATLMGHVVFRRNAGKIQPIVTLTAPNGGAPYCLEQDDLCKRHERLAKQANLLRSELKQLCQTWELHTASDYAHKALA